MNEICSKCGLPKDLCVCEEIAKEEQKIIVKIVKRRYGKLATLVEGIDTKSVDIKEVARTLKSKLACGGTAKEGIIELQGNHVSKVKNELVKLGFSTDSIIIVR